MAKQDLVVKLMLDSGAFGNDLRQAEQRAREFSNKMKSAGDSAGAFGREIGLSAGALGKLGGMLTGAGAVVAAVGAFKSVMESSAESSKKFNGAIAGVQGVIGELQTALATFDFTTFMNGMDDVFRRAKEFKENMTDLQFSNIAYGYLSSEHMAGLKEAELKYRNATTDDEKKAASDAANAIITVMNSELDALIKDINDTFVSGVLKKDAGKLKDGVSPEQAAEWTKQALRYTLLEYKEQDQTDYKNIIKEIAEIDAVLNTGVGQLYGDTRENMRDTWYGRQFDKMIEKIAPKLGERYDRYDEISANKEYYAKYLEDLIKNNQDLFFRNALYKYKPEELSTLINLLTDAANKSRAVSEAELQVKGWSGSSATKTTGGSGGSNGQIKLVENSIADLQDKLSKAKKAADNAVVGTDNWWKAQENIKTYTKQLNEALLLQNKLLHPMEPLPKLPDILPKGLTAPEIGIKNPYLSTTEEVEEVAKMAKDYEGLNTVLSSTVFLFNSLGSAIEDTGDKSSQNAIEMMNIFSAIAEGAMNVIPALQALTAAEGASEAAKTPWPANIAAILSIVATVTSVFASIKQIKNNKFAEGGIVGGTSYSGDKLFAMVNSGEMILNKRQQGNLANMLGGGGQVEFHISGDSLVGVLNNKRHKTNLTR